jgi:hypothetical protein
MITTGDELSAILAHLFFYKRDMIQLSIQYSAECVTYDQIKPIIVFSNIAHGGNIDGSE